MRKGIGALAATLVLSACHASTPEPTTPAPTTPTVASQPASRRLAAASTFAELVGRARSIEASGDAVTEARCVLGGAGEALTLEASIVPAIRPLPDAPTRLAERAMQSTSVTVLSRWGRVGAGPLALATITASPPLDADTVVLLVTPRGIYLRTTAAGLPERARGNWALGALPGGLESLDVQAGDTVIVTAEGAMTIGTLADVLAAIAPLGVHAVLAVALPESTPIPAEITPPAPTLTTCEALPLLGEDVALGDVRVEDVRRSVSSLGDVALACARSTSSPAVARGGRVDLMLRIGPDGRVTETCARTDEIGDETFRGCLLGAARQMRFTPPSPAGFVDVVAPVRLRADTSDALSPTCTR